MAEFGLASGVVGCVSLGITLCQGLRQYYEAYKDQDEVVRNLLKSVGRLQNICEVLDSALRALEGKPFPEESIAAVNKSLQRCKTDFGHLQRKLEKVETRGFPKPEAKGWKMIREKMRKALYPFGEATLIKLRDIVADSRDNLQLAITALNLQMQIQKFEEIETQISEVKIIVTAVKDNFGSFYTEYASDQQFQRRHKIFSWLSPFNPFSHHDKARRERLSDTGEWFLKSPVYEDWRSRKLTFLCLYGIPGCGKTVLCSTIIEAIEKCCEEEPGSALGYFYFDYRAEKRRAEDLIRSLLVQFAVKANNADTDLADLYSRSRDGLREPDVEELEEKLKNMVKSCTSAYIVVDALDECLDREELRETIGRMIKWESDNSVHLLFMTREDEDLRNALDEVKLVQYYKPVDKGEIDGDIRKFVQKKLREDRRLSVWPDKTKSDIEKTLTQGSNGMFRWVVCQIDALRRCVRLPQLDTALQSLPKTLNATYERDLCAINDVNVGDALKILQWLSFCARPLRLSEIGDALAVDRIDGSLTFDKNNRPQQPEDVFVICPSLITLEAGPVDEGQDSVSHNSNNWDGEVRLAHFSVKDYLTSPEIRSSKAQKFSLGETSAHPLMAEISLVYLLQFGRPDIASSDIPHHYPLAKYAARYWHHHISRITEDVDVQNIQPLVEELLDANGRSFENWRRVHDPDRSQPRVFRRRRNIGCGSPLYYASLLGLSGTVSKLLQGESVDVNAQGGSFGNALQAACAQGHYKVVELLLDSKRAKIDCVNGYFGTALQAACYNGHEKIVDLLFKNGCNVDIEGGDYGTALQAASLQGHKPIVKKLLEKGACVDSSAGEYQTALQAAASQRHVDICKLLMEKRPNVNTRGGRYDTALEAASYSGSEPIVRLLRREGAEINGQPHDRHNPLQAAAFRGHRDIVELLLKEGADIDVGEGIYGNPLQAASYRNQISIVELLLAQMAPVSIRAKSKDGETALHWGAMSGDSDLIRILIEKGLDPTERDSNEWTPVLVAWMYQRGSIGHDRLVSKAGKASYEGSFGLPPTRLVKALECSGMAIKEDGITACLENPNYEDLVSGAQLRSDHPFTARAGRQYFRIEVIETGPESIIGIGLCDKTASRGAMPGWNPRQWAYHGDDGMAFAETGTGHRYGPTWGKGDLIGCGLDMDQGGTGTIFFTKNGIHLGDAFHGVKGRFLPVIGTREKGTKVKVEFGLEFTESRNDSIGASSSLT